MKHLFLAASAIALLATAPAWAQATGQPSFPTTGQRHPVVNQQDTTFVDQAAAGGIAEVEFGRLAAQKAVDPAVQELGRWMVTDHSLLNRRLAAVAAHEGMPVAMEMDAAHREEFQKLQNVPREQFDPEYMQGQLRDHEETVGLFQKEEGAGENHLLKAFANMARPMLQAHLEQAQILAKAPAVAGSAAPSASGTSTTPAPNR